MRPRITVNHKGLVRPFGIVCPFGILRPFMEEITLEEYVIWDYTTPGISFSINSGRITIFKTTLEAMGYPEYYHFLFSPEDMLFGIEPCNIDDGGSRSPVSTTTSSAWILCASSIRPAAGGRS